MSRSAGTYTLPSNSVSPAVADTVISPTDFNTVMDDIEAGINESTYTAGLGATDNRLVRTDGTDTKKIQGSGVTVDDSANMSGVAALSTTTIELGHATDTTISRTGAGAIAVEGVGVALNSVSLTHTAGTIELGHATDTTISRTGAGAIAVEGVGVALNSISLAHTAGTIELGHATDTTISRTAAGAIAVEGVGVALNSISLAHTAGTIELGHATDTTIARSGAGDITIEGNAVYRAGGTDVAVADGGTGASTAAGGFRALAEGISSTQGAIMYRDATQWVALAPGVSGQLLRTNGAAANPSWITASGTGDVVGPAGATDNAVARFDGATGKIVQNSGVIIDDTNNISPTSNDGGALGTTALMWSDLFLASGGVINFNNGDVTVTHSADALTFQGGASGYLFSHAVVPQTSDGAALGSTANMWSDLFLASGAVVNFNNGNVTLTHAAGSLTVAGATTVSLGTSAALTTGTIELGHASDTTLSRSAAGELAIEGTLVKKVGKETIWVPAAAMTARTTNGAASGTTELATNDIMLRSFDFDTTTEEGVGFMIAMPKSWNESTVTFKAFWTAASGSGGVAWGLAAYALSDDDAMDTAVSGQQIVTDTLITANDMHITAESSAITIGGTPAEGDVVYFEITREVANGSDTIAADAKLIGIHLYITTNASTDA